jgi:hypothetical protein
MFFKTFGYVTMGQALAFTGDLSVLHIFSNLPRPDSLVVYDRTRPLHENSATDDVLRSSHRDDCILLRRHWCAGVAIREHPRFLLAGQ